MLYLFLASEFLVYCKYQYRDISWMWSLNFAVIVVIVLLFPRLRESMAIMPNIYITYFFIRETRQEKKPKCIHKSYRNFMLWTHQMSPCLFHLSFDASNSISIKLNQVMSKKVLQKLLQIASNQIIYGCIWQDINYNFKSNAIQYSVRFLLVFRFVYFSTCLIFFFHLYLSIYLFGLVL